MPSKIQTKVKSIKKIFAGISLVALLFVGSILVRSVYGDPVANYGACPYGLDCTGSASTGASSLGNSSTISSSTAFSVTSSQPAVAALALKVNLSGSFRATNSSSDNGGKMVGLIREANLLSTTQPFNIQPFNYQGTENVTSFNNDIIDWVLVKITNVNDPSKSITKALVLRADGKVLETDQNSNIGLPASVFSASSNSFQVIVLHRNHIGISTNNPIVIQSNSTNNAIDFTNTSGNSNIKGNNQSRLNPADTINPPIYGLKNGDINGDGNIDAGDRNLLRNSPETNGVYSPKDLNMDGSVDAADRTIIRLAPETSQIL